MIRFFGSRGPRSKNATAVIAQLDAVATLLDAEAAAASGQDAKRFKALAATMKGRASKLRQ